jgi:PEP-CTERM motif-containing protein
LIQPESGIVRQDFRRRRTRRHRRNRLLRRGVFLFTLGLFAAILSAIAVRHFSPSLFLSSSSPVPGRRQAEDSRTRLLLANEEQAFRPQAGARPLYPYSMVPGGVENARELKWVAEHDPVVAAHYAGFDYDHARVVRLVLARTAYVSYRIGGHVYWTRRRVTIHKGEKVITDGKITARARCANRIEELPQQATASPEPPIAKFEEPMRAGDGTAVRQPPVPFQSALLNRPGVSTFEPNPPLSLYSPVSAGGWAPFFPPPLPTGGVCAPGKKKGDLEPDGDSDDKKKKGGSCSGPPESVPEPGTWLLMASGLAGIYWNARRRFARI